MGDDEVDIEVDSKNQYLNFGDRGVVHLFLVGFLGIIFFQYKKT